MFKDVTQYTKEEIEEIWKKDSKLAFDFRNVYLGMLSDLEAELRLISTTLSDFTQRSSALMTISGLLAFLPSLVDIQKSEYLKSFLIFTFPFLFFSIICFYFSSIRIGSFRTQMLTATPGTSSELLILQSNVISFQKIWQMNLEHYYRVLKWFRLHTALIYAYIISFSINFYLFSFLGKPDAYVSMNVFLISLLSGIAIIVRGWSKSKKGVNFVPDILISDLGEAQIKEK